MGIRRIPPAFHSLVVFAFLLFAAGSLSQAQVDLQIMAANLSSGNYQSYDPGEGARIMKGILPDVVMIQEFNYGDGSDTAISGFVSSTFGPSFSYARGNGSAQIPNGIISRYPILDSGEWVDPQVDNRDFVWARIDVPGSIDLYAISVHLLTKSASVRNSEAISLRNFIQQSIPTGAYIAIGGDFNTDSRSEAALSTLGSVVVTTGPYPADKNGNVNTNAGRNKPYDGVYVSSNLNGKATATVIGNSSFANGLVADTRVFTPISAISPALASDSGASSMQHMGVVRDFILPVPEPGSVWLISGVGIWLLLCRRFRGPRSSAS